VIENDRIEKSSRGERFSMESWHMIEAEVFSFLFPFFASLFTPDLNMRGSEAVACSPAGCVSLSLSPSF
jgi:hypothetical protein